MVRLVQHFTSTFVVSFQSDYEVFMQAQVASRTPVKLLPLLGKRKRPLSGLPAQAAYAKHAKLLAVSAKLADPESKPLEPPEKLVKYYQGMHTKLVNSTLSP